MVREKEIGTIEQINVTPVRKYHFIIAKMVPFLLIGLIDLALGLTIGKIAFNIPFEGSILVMFLGSAVFLVAVLGLALFISTFSGTQQQYMFVAFFCMIIFILMSGIFTPYESMPMWAQDFNLINPVAYLMRINRMVMLKGSTIHGYKGGADFSCCYCSCIHYTGSQKVQKNSLKEIVNQRPQDYSSTYVTVPEAVFPEIYVPIIYIFVKLFQGKDI